MPLYEYQCLNCKKIFEELINKKNEAKIFCPYCKNKKIKKIISKNTFNKRSSCCNCNKCQSCR